MIDPESRYASVTVLVHIDADGREHRYLDRRIVAPADSFTALAEVVVHDGDRLDLLTARTLGQPGLWWRLADANEAMDPAEATAAPGRKLRIPSPF